MIRRLFPVIALLLMVIGAKADKVVYALQKGDIHNSGDMVSVKDTDGNEVASLIFGETDGAEFSAAIANSSIEGYTAYTAGNGVNGNKAGFYGFAYTYENNTSNLQCEKPIISFSDGVISIASSTEGATIYYTLDDSTPTRNSTKYEGPITLTQNCTVKAIAVAEGYVDSEVASYTVDWFAEGGEGNETSMDEKNWDFIANDVWRAEGIVLNNGTQYDENANAVTSGGVTFTGKSGFVSTTKGIGFNAIGSLSDENISIVVPAGKKAIVSAYTSSARTLTVNFAGTIHTFKENWVSSAKEFDNTAGTTDITLYLYCDKYCGGASKPPYLEKIILTTTSGYVTPASPTPTFVREGNLLYISCSDTDATIYYTTDDSTPTRNSTKYEEPITLTQNCTVKAIAMADGYQDSEVATYTVDWFNPSINENKVLYSWDKNGSDVGSNEITFDDSVKLAITGNREKSLGRGAKITLGEETLTTIKLSNGAQNTMYLLQPAKKITFYSYINNDGTDGRESYWKEVAGTVYEDAASSGGVMAAYRQDGTYDTRSYILNNVKEITFTNAGSQVCCLIEIEYASNEENPIAATPTFIRNDNTLTINSGTERATIYYTLDGSTPTQNSNVYAAPITLTQNCTVKAIAVAEGYLDSEVATYTVDWFNISIPDFCVVNENEVCAFFEAPTSWSSVSCWAWDSNNNYTGGSWPGAACTKVGINNGKNVWKWSYSGTLSTQPAYIIFNNRSNGGQPQTNDLTFINRGYYNEDGALQGVVTNVAVKTVCATPTFQRNGNNLTISSSTDGAVIYYTMDGSTPTRNSNAYTTPITLTQNCTVKAIAVAEGYEDSEVATYTVDWFTTSNPEIKIDFNPYDRSEGEVTESGYIPWAISESVIDTKIFDNGLSVSISAGGAAKRLISTWNISNGLKLIGDGIRTISGISEDTGDVIVSKSSNSIELAITGLSSGTHTLCAYHNNPYSEENQPPIEVLVNGTVYATGIVCTSDAKSNSLSGKSLVSFEAIENQPVLITYRSIIAEGENYTNSSVFLNAIELDTYKSQTSSVIFSIKDNLLTMTSATKNATIYYTMDGSNPTTSSNVYSNPITLTQNCTIKAIAVAEGYEDSKVATYAVDWFKVEEVSITFVNLKVILSTTTPNARIYYTTDGSTPTENCTRYTEPFAVSNNCTVKAIAYKDNFNASEVTSLFIDLNSVKCDTPTFQMSGGILTISTLTEGTVIYYTLDGTTPTVASERYIGPVTLTRNCIVKALATKDGYLNSEVGGYEVTYFQVEMPSFTSDGSILAISCGTQGASIYYVLGDGALEIIEQNRYVGPIALTDNRAVRAVGVLDGYRNSEEAVYRHNSITCGEVAFNFDGHYIRMLSATEGATIYYTTDGSNPTSASTYYSEPVAVDELCTINAIATKENMNNSKVAKMELAYVYDGTTVAVKEAGLLSKAFEWHQGTSSSNKLEVRGSLNTVDLEFVKTLSTVEHLDMKNVTFADQNLPDQSFANMNLVSIELPSGITQVGKGLFSGCNRMAAIIWNANKELTSEAMEGLNNPNLLVYANSLTFVPTSTNVVSMVNDKALNIVLCDAENGNFYCPRKFTAQQISYTRDFILKSGRGASAGWETIALPFSVATITHEKNGLLAPFGSGVAGAKPFWLYSLQNTGFNPAMEIVANTPYIICMPNHEDYADEYNQGGSVTFAATNVTVPVTATQTSVQETERSTIYLIPTFSRMEKSNSLYAINREAYGTLAPGSVFMQDSRDVYPFEAYSTISMKNVGAPMPQFIPIFDDNTTTGIIDIPLAKVSDDIIKVYSLNGLLVKSLSSENELKQLPKGVYIVNGRKVVVK